MKKRSSSRASTPRLKTRAKTTPRPAARTPDSAIDLATARAPDAVDPARQAAEPRAAADVLTLDDAIAFLKTTRPTFYRWLRDGRIKAYKAGRQWRFQRDDLERFLKGHQPRVDLPVSLAPLIDALRDRLAAAGQTPDPRDDDPLTHAVRLMIKLAYYQRASDLHIAPHFEPTPTADEPRDRWSAMLRFRIDGLLHEILRFDLRLLPAVIERWKTFCALDVAEARVSQDGRMHASVDGHEIDIRVCIVPANGGPTLTARLLRPDALHFDLADIGYSDADLHRLQAACRSRSGLILVAGPTGTGKTTTLYSCLMQLASPAVKIMTVEDPIEYVLPYTVQVPLNPAAGMTFPLAMRSFLRSGTDAIMVGEIRDNETLQLCPQAALTGHLVFTTLHAEDTARALRRCLEIGLPHFLLADTAVLLLAQRLLRKLCPHCSQSVELSQEEQRQAAEIATRGGLGREMLAGDFRRPVGCAKCGDIGFAGRVVAAETIRMTPALAAAIRADKSADDLRAIAIADGTTTMAADALRKAAAGLTTLTEIHRVLGGL